MRRRMTLSLAGWLAALALPAPAQAEVVQAFEMQTPFAPVLADMGGVRQLAYELHLTNFAGRAITVERVTVLDADGATLAMAEGDDLAAWMGRAGARNSTDVRTVSPGTRTLVYFNLPVAGAAPRTVAHRIDFRFAEGDDRTPRQLTDRAIPVDPRQPVTLGPPLRGGPWAAVYAPEMERGHRRVVYATEGAARIPGRFAIDWIRLNDDGWPAPTGATRLDGFFGHDAEVLAVADAVVAAVRDDIVEAETLGDVPAVTIGDASGNYVALDLGDGRYAFYEHLRQGILVRPGQRVRRGEVIGRLGLTGQGSEPHLHFHVADANSVLGADGLPFVLEGVEILGAYASIEAFGRGGPWIAAAGPPPSRPFTPAPNSVVRLPD